MNRVKTLPHDQIKKAERVTFMDGIRGWAAITVLFYHYLLSFYPALFTLDDPYFHTTSHFEAKITLTPFNIFYSSGFAVCLFFVISGFALSYGFFASKNIQIVTASAIRRYFRLSIPILFSVFVSYVIIIIHQYYNAITAQYSNNTFWLSQLWNVVPDFSDMLKEGTFTSLFIGGTLKYNSVLWTMSIEFLDSIIVFAILALFGTTRNRFWIYALLIIIFHTGYLAAFIIGLALCDHYHSRQKKNLPGYLLILIFIAAFYFGSYQDIGKNTIWNRLDWLTNIDRSYPFIIGASLFVFGAINSPWIQGVFNSKPIQFLGKISFSLYLLHLSILGSFGCFFFNLLYAQLHLGYFLSFILMFTVALPVTIVASYMMYRYIDLTGINFSKSFYKKFFK